MSQKCRTLVNEDGQALIQVLVSIGIMGIVMAVLTSMQTMQARENQSLSEKLGALDADRVVQGVIASQSACGMMFDSTNLVGSSSFSASSVSAANPHVFAIKAIPGSGLSSGGQVSPLSMSLYLKAANANPPGLKVSVTSPTTANLEVNFDNTKLVRVIKSLTFENISITTTGTGPLTITGCGTSSPPPGGGWNCPPEQNGAYNACVRPTDGTICRRTISTWDCFSPPGWPGASDWACGSRLTYMYCVRLSDGNFCLHAPNLGPNWSCVGSSGWPGGSGWNCFGSAGSLHCARSSDGMGCISSSIFMPGVAWTCGTPYTFPTN